MNSIQKTARMTGLLYFIYILLTIATSIFGYAPLIVFGDATTTAVYIKSHEWQFRIGFMGDLVAALLFLMTAWGLYVILKPVNKNLALLFLALNISGVAIQSINLLNLFAPLLLFHATDFLKVFESGQVEALAMLFLNLHKNGFMIAQIFYGTWVFPLGYLVYRSGFLPKWLGVLLMVECFTWLAYFFQFFFFPAFTAVTYLSFPLGFLAEFSLTLWLLIKGVNVTAWDLRANNLADGK